MKHALIAAGLLAAGMAGAQEIPDIKLLPVASGFQSPVQVVSAPDGSGRLFVVEQAGRIRILDRSPAQQHAAFLTLRNVRSGGEMGLLGLAFHPDFRSNRRLFVNYTTGEGNKLTTHVSEFTARPDLSAAGPLSERVLLRIRQPYPNHNGGLVLFGPDGYLYIGTGDGGSGNDPENNGQRLNTLLGKILRIDVNRAPQRRAYGIPPDNPFAGSFGARPEIFAYGLRNPWRFSFDRESGLLFCGDVGQNAREEIDVVRKGGNYGWKIMEGTICTPGVNPDCNTDGLELPVIDYGRDQGVSVTGGYVYRGSAHPALAGVYVYGDFGSGRIWGLRYFDGKVIAHRLLLETGFGISSFGEDASGELLVVDYGGRIFQVAKPD